MPSNISPNFRGLGVQGFRPLLRFSVNLCKPLYMRVSGIFGQGFRKVSAVQTPASPYPCGFQAFTTYQCSKEHARTAVRHASTSLSYVRLVIPLKVDFSK